MVSGVDPPTSPSVIIVGAGISGISAAKTLHEAGIHDFIILEATSRIGGRIKKQEFAGHTIEVGANWLHGTGGSKSSPLFEMAKEIKLKMFRSDFSGVPSNTYTQDGGLFSKEEVETTMKVAEIVDEMGAILSKYWAYKPGLPGLDDDISISELQRQSHHVPITPLEMVIDYFYHDYEDSEPPWITGLKHTLPRCAKEDFGTDAHFVADPRGFEAVVHHIAKQFISYKPGLDDDISTLELQRRFHHVPITPLEMVIDYFYHDYEDSEPPRITSLKHTLPRCAKEDFGTDAHFVADPRGFEAIVHQIAKQFLSYKGEDITDPRIKLNQVVKKIYYSKSGVEVTTEEGCTYHAKAVVVSVSIGVLQSDLIAFEPALPEWKKQAITEFSMGTFTKIFLQFPHRFWPTGPGTEFFLYAHQKRGYYPIWQHLENEMPGANILFVLMTHEESARIEQQSQNETIADVMQVLRKMFGNDIPKPSRIFIPRWKSDRFYRGAYSNWPNGYSEARHEQLCEPVGPVHFTGEHTNVPYLGYADGAYLAGIKTANDVIRYLQKSSICERTEEESITPTVARKL
ncbi:hypothetical protein Droror1_Dr00021259 [Drosera rotundifolia]